MTNDDKPTFQSMGLSTETLEAINRMDIYTPTAVQVQSIPPMLGWHDLIAKAPTGTGKTLAFGVPIIEHMEKGRRDLQAIILAPTRELALQIGEDMGNLCVTRPWIETVVVYGGQSIKTQTDALRRKPQIVVATPGRLIDHMKRRNIRLDDVEIAVLDEADRMLDMGFVRDVRYILDRLVRVSQIAMFSATLSRSVMDISYLYQREPIEITVHEEGLERPDIDEYVLPANGAERIDYLGELLKDPEFERVMIFVNMKQSASIVVSKLRARKINVDEIHGDIRQNRRELVLSRFRKGNLRVLVATDVAARGLDIDDVDLVVNYDLPNENESYIHRIGRTGRARKKGKALTFLNPTGQQRLQEILRFAQSEPRFLKDISEISDQ